MVHGRGFDSPRLHQQRECHPAEGWHFRWDLHAASTGISLTPQELNTLLRQAQSFHQAGRLAEAERDYLRLAEAAAGNAELWHLLGVIAYQQGHYGPAIERYRKTIDLRGDFAQAHNNLALALKATGQMESAAAEFAAALAAKP